VKLTIGAIVKFTPLAAAHWREYREGTVIELSDTDAVVEYADGLKRTVPRGDLVSIDTPPSIEVGKMVVGDDDSA
jgi:hypothetical protein